MDKTEQIQTHVKHHKGFALMITLSVLSVIIALTMVLLSYFEEVQQDASNTKALIQADLYYADITTIFKGIKEKKTLFSVLYGTVLPLGTEDGRFSLLLKCEALNKGVNINWLGLTTNAKNQARVNVAQELFEMLAQEYSIEDPGRLLELLYEEMGDKDQYSTQNQSRLHQKKGIISYQQFVEIVSRYQFEVDDPEIGRVPWEKYFSFSRKSDKIDGEYSSPELIAYLFSMDLSTVKEWASVPDRTSLETFVNTNGGSYAQRKMLLVGKEFLEETQCSVRYALDEAYYRFRFEYSEGEAKHFEFYGKE
ncbi:MAG TPA: hypothetical protein EYH57_06740 [Sulfurovum sp.]|nr:hypothetical protein [Sulfurovum sp.]